MEFIHTAKCELCGKEYDDWMRRYYVEYKGQKTCVCSGCRHKFVQDKYWFINYIPAYCDGGDLVAKCFDTLEELREYIVSNTKENQIATFNNGWIVDVYTTKEFWWVRGSVSHKLDLPSYHNTLEDLGYKH